MEMHQNTRDLGHAGLYLLSLALFLAGGYYSVAFAIKNQQGSAVLVAAISAIAPDTLEPTRLSVNMQNAREVRAALDKPIAGPPKLLPITAKLAYGHLKPGGKDYLAVVVQKPKRRSIPRAALDAMAMQPPPPAGHALGFRQHSYVPPDQHKVY